MAAERRTLWLALALVAALVVAAVVWTSGRSGTSTPAPRAATAARPPGGAPPVPNEAPAHVNLDTLKVDRGEPIDAGRNPFRFEPRPPPSAPAPSVSTPLRPGNEGPVAPSVPAVPPGPPPPPPIPLKFIGLFTQGGVRVAVLTDGKSSPQGGKEGDIILGQYRILKIGNESIEMAHLDGRGRQTIRLTGQ